MRGLSNVKDDWVCKRCPSGSYLPGPSQETSCLTKTTSAACVGLQELVKRDNRVVDDECVVPAECTAGYQVGLS